MSETDKDLVYSEGVKAGKRIYYFDVKRSRNGDKYIAITESKKTNEGTPENPRFTIQKHKLFLYKEDYDKFTGALTLALRVARGEITPEEAEASRPGEAERTGGRAQGECAPAQELEEKTERRSFLDKVKDIF